MVAIATYTVSVYEYDKDNTNKRSNYILMRNINSHPLEIMFILCNDVIECCNNVIVLPNWETLPNQGHLHHWLPWGRIYQAVIDFEIFL